jgi:predicted nucleotidyltransferase
MYRTTDDSVRVAAIGFANCLVPFWQAELGPELLGLYLIGSLAHGGFSRRYSDIDIAVVTEAGLSTQTRDRVRGQAMALSADLGSRLSVFWADRYFSRGRFPPLDRVDYLDHGLALMERHRVWPARPSHEEIRRYLAGGRLQTGGPRRDASRAPKSWSRKTASYFCGRSSIRRGSATAG